MQSLCLVFAGRRGLDEFSSRQSVGRIPEVSHKLKEAQAFFDSIRNKKWSVDLFSALQAPDDEFAAKQHLRLTTVFHCANWPL